MGLLDKQAMRAADFRQWLHRRGGTGRLPRLSGFSRLVSGLGLLLIGGIWLFVYQQVHEDYIRTMAETSQGTMNLAIAFEEHVRRVVSDADKDLVNLKLLYEREGPDSPGINNYMQINPADPSRSLIAIYDETGEVVNVLLPGAGTMNAADRDYFRARRDTAGDDLVISRPITGRMTGQPIIPLTRRINRPDGSFGGIVSVGMRDDYFLAFYQRIDLGPGQFIALTGKDGFNRTRRSGDDVEGGQDVRSTELWRRVQAGQSSGTYTARSYRDGVTRIMSYRVMPDYPLIVSVGKAADTALAGYYDHERGSIVGAAAASLLILVLGLLLIAQHEKFRDQRKAVQEQNEKLLVAEEKLLAQNEELVAREKEISGNNLILAQTGEAVQKEKDWLAALINSIGDEVWFLDPDGRFLLVNKAARQEFRFPSRWAELEELDDKVVWLRPDGSPRPFAEAPAFRALRGENVVNAQSIVRTPAKSEYRHRETSSNPVRDKTGQIIGAVSIVRDITERKRMEQELAEHRQHLQSLVAERTRELEAAVQELHLAGERLAEQARLLDLAHDYVLACDLEGKIIYWNRGAEAGYGWSAGEAEGQLATGLLRTRFPVPEQDILNCLLAEGRWEGEIGQTSKDGVEIEVKSYRTLNRDAAGIPVSILAIDHDISAQKAMEAELARLDRLNIIGEMAASIGHEVRNPLTTVRGYLQLLSRKAVGARYRDQFRTMIEELDRANGIISEFLSLAKNKAIELKPHNLNAIIEALAPLLQAEALRIGHAIRFDLGRIPDTELDEKEVRQLLINFARNGFEAMESGGLLTVRTYAEEGRVIMAIGDTGKGIPPKVLEKIGTPFVTTKANGAGLGLAVCYRIAERHGARIDVKTSPRGTVFSVAFNHSVSQL